MYHTCETRRWRIMFAAWAKPTTNQRSQLGYVRGRSRSRLGLSAGLSQPPHGLGLAAAIEPPQLDRFGESHPHPPHPRLSAILLLKRPSMHASVCIVGQSTHARAFAVCDLASSNKLAPSCHATNNAPPWHAEPPSLLRPQTGLGLGFKLTERSRSCLLHDPVPLPPSRTELAVHQPPSRLAEKDKIFRRARKA